jgi:hypothetical protein
MNENDIEQAIGRHLETMSDCPPVAWPNMDFDPKQAPDGYLEFRHAPSDRYDDTIDATGPIQVGIVLVTAVLPAGNFATAANALASRVAQRFPKTLRLTSTEGTVLITAPASPSTGFQDGAYFRKPVRIFYITE